jgi:precorrin-6Y C5,15-methyltransferase (decarboxylating)
LNQHTLFLIGMGPGTAEWVTTAAWKAVDRCQNLFAGKRIIRMVVESGMIDNFERRVWHEIDARLSTLILPLTEALEQGDVAVLTTGDTGAFSVAAWIGKQIRVKNPEQKIETIAGISSIQYFCARLGRNWPDLDIVSLHGKEDDSFVNKLSNHRKTMLLTDPRHHARWIADTLLERGMDDFKITVGLNLSYPDEMIVSGGPADLLCRDDIPPDALCLVLLEPSAPRRLESQDKVAPHDRARSFAGGLPDESFVRGAKPMTKQAVRAQIASLLAICPGDICWDIGAGTGSVSVEMALATSDRGSVFAIERDSAGTELVRRNAAGHNVENIVVVEGEAPLALQGLPCPDRVFIGGSGGNLQPILAHLGDLMSAANLRKTDAERVTCKVVISAVTLETPTRAVELLRANGFEPPQIMQLAVTHFKQRGGYNMAQAENPVWLIQTDWPAK